MKICGMTSKKDIDICVQNNINTLGFLLAPKSGKYKREDILQSTEAKELIKYVPSNIETCLLIHLKDINEVLETIKELNPSMIQIQKQSMLSLSVPSLIYLREMKRKRSLQIVDTCPKREKRNYEQKAFLTVS